MKIKSFILSGSLAAVIAAFSFSASAKSVDEAVKEAVKNDYKIDFKELCEKDNMSMADAYTVYRTIEENYINKLKGALHAAQRSITNVIPKEEKNRNNVDKEALETIKDFYVTIHEIDTNNSEHYGVYCVKSATQKNLKLR